MDIERLRLRITEESVSSLAQEHLPPNAGVQDLKIALTAEGVQVSGRYTGMLLPLSFETLWEPGVNEGRLQARLAQVRVAGFPATRLRGVLLSTLADNVNGVPGLQISEDVVTLDANVFFQGQKVPLRMTFTAIHCQAGLLVLEV